MARLQVRWSQTKLVEFRCVSHSCNSGPAGSVAHHGKAKTFFKASWRKGASAIHVGKALGYNAAGRAAVLVIFVDYHGPLFALGQLQAGTNFSLSSVALSRNGSHAAAYGTDFWNIVMDIKMDRFHTMSQSICR
jgi:hypothetical protein